MKRLNILCEGPTEERFVKKMLYPHLIQHGVWANAIGLGGGFNFDRLKFNVVQLLNKDKNAFVTTLIDLYGIRPDCPGYDEHRSEPPLERVKNMEKAILEDILATRDLHNHHFMPHFQLHEFEAMLFSKPAEMEAWLSLDQKIRTGSFSQILEKFGNPELINDDPTTAPSKRIEALAPAYNKIVDGNNILELIGLETIRTMCPHFDAWLSQLEKIGARPAA